MPSQPSSRVLIVDDDPGVLASYRLVLEESTNLASRPELAALERELFGETRCEESGPRLQFRYVEQGDDAVEVIKEALQSNQRYAAVFLDIRMPPGMDGYDTAEAIRKMDPDVHIVFVSGYSDFNEEDLLQVAGPATRMTMLPKPVWPDTLRETTWRICSEDLARRKPAA